MKNKLILTTILLGLTAALAVNLPVAQEVASDTSNLWESRIRWMQETQVLQVLAPELEESILSYLAANYGQKTYSRRAPLDTQLMPENPFQSDD